MNSSGCEIHYVDSHTEGEPTRVIIQGGPELGDGTIRQKFDRLRKDSDTFRRSVIKEPRGYEALVGALLLEPSESSAVTGVIFFNNIGYLGMCGHGAIGVAVTLHHLGRIELGKHRFETPVGLIEVDLLGPHEAAIENVPCFRLESRVTVEVEGIGKVTGDIAWGGNWFFLVENSPVPLSSNNIGRLSDAAGRIRKALNRDRITGADGAEIDHIEFFGKPISPQANSRNFVYCPGGAFDRSPCGTGTSAKLACLAADGKLRPGEQWVQESIIGSRFKASYRIDHSNQVIPKITGRAFICSKGVLLRQPADPFKNGIEIGEATPRS